MNKNDFRYMRRGKQLQDLKKDDLSLMQPIYQYGKKTEKALLLLHGFSSSPAVFRFLIPQLKNYDAIICPALPGHGENIQAFSEIKAADWISFTTKVCEDLFKKYTKVDVLGFSLGGLLACKLSEQFAFNHIFLLAPALKLTMNINAHLKLTFFLIALGFKELRSAAGNLITDDQAEISYKRIPLSTISEILNLILHHQWTAPKSSVDLFLGARDDVVSSDQVEQLFHNLPQVSIHWLEHSAHVLPLDNDLGQIVDCINNRP